jgi:putative DNA primase/helicase
MDPQKGIAKLLEFLLRDIEGGRTLPEGWDAGLTEEQLEHPTIAAIAEKNKAERWDFVPCPGVDPGTGLDEAAATTTGRCSRSEMVEAVAGRATSTSSSSTAHPAHQNALGKGAKMARRSDQADVQGSARRRRGEEIAEDYEAIARQVIEDIGRGGELRHDQGMPSGSGTGRASASSTTMRSTGTSPIA